MTEKTKGGWPDLTIVGGQPRRRPKNRGTIEVPVGVEKLLFRAAQDPGFRQRLLEDPVAAAEGARIGLRPSEKAMLAVVPRATLETMISGIEPQNPRKRKFMGLVAAAAASLAAGTAGCDDTDSGADDDADTIYHDSGFINAGGIDADIDVDTDVDSDSDSDLDSEVDVDSDADSLADADSTGDADADSAEDADPDD